MTPVCPKCDVGLFILEFKGIELDFCHKCRGVWLDSGELEALMETTGASTDDPLLQFQKQQGKQPSGTKHLCPRCDRALLQLDVRDEKRPPLTLDRCPRGHGLWFDADELQQLLARFPPQTGAGKTIDFLNEVFTPVQKTKLGGIKV